MFAERQSSAQRNNVNCEHTNRYDSLPTKNELTEKYTFFLLFLIFEIEKKASERKEKKKLLKTN